MDLFEKRRKRLWNRRPEMSKNEWAWYFSKRLCQRIYDMGMDQKDLAIAADISESSISRYCNGIRVPDAYDLSKIAEALCCEVSDLTDDRY